jgi:site-specific DNA recombinase
MTTYNNRAVLYSRTSTKGQSKDKIFSPQEQLKLLRKYADTNNWYNAYELIENDSAFHDGLNRPELNKVRQMAQRKMIDAILFYDLSRFTRDVADGILLYRELISYGVRIISITEGEITEDNQLIYIFTNYQNQEWVKRNREKSMIGFRGKAESGIYHGMRNAPFGYELTGRRKTTALTIVEERANVVRAIFKWYGMDGHTITEIAKHLTDNRVTTPGEYSGQPRQREKGMWGPDSVKKILRNELYAGVAYTFRTQKVNGKVIPRPKEEWIAVEVPAIVPKSLFDLAQAKLNEGKQNSPRNKIHNYLAGSRVKCGLCDSSLSGLYDHHAHFTYYRCNSARGYTVAQKCDLPYIRGDMLDTAIWVWVQRLLEEPKVVLQGYRDMQKEMHTKTAHIRQQIADINKEIDTRKAQLERLLDAYEIGSIPKDMLQQRANEYKGLLDTLEPRRESLMLELQDNTLSDEEIAYMIGTIEEYRKSLQDDWMQADYDTRRAFVEALGLYFTVSYEHGEKVVYIKWLYNRFRVVMTTGDDSEMPKGLSRHFSISASKCLMFRLAMS